MLFIESKTLDQRLDGATRLLLLDALAAKGFAPLIRSMRRRCFALSLTIQERTPEEHEIDAFERRLLEAHAGEWGGGYTPGELFFFQDHALHLVFGDAEGQSLCAGIVYNLKTEKPLLQLELFCQSVSDALRDVLAAPGQTHVEASDLTAWRSRSRHASEGLASFIARQDSELTRSLRCREGSRERLRAVELLQDPAVRAFLRRAEEARLEGYSPKLLSGAGRALGALTLDYLAESGLVRREVRVSCRKTGHPLFDLPSPDALALITVSRAKCSQCAEPVADEVVEEVYNPTKLALSLMEDGTWLRTRVYRIIRGLGIADSEIAVGSSSERGEAHMAVNVCDEPFLFAVRDGDLSPAFVRRVMAATGEADVRHIVVVVTGKVEDEGRMRLYEYAWRRARDGKDVGISISEGLERAETEIGRAFERAAGRALDKHLNTLDAALGTSAARLLLSTFKLMKTEETTTRATASTDASERQQPATLELPPARLRYGS